MRRLFRFLFVGTIIGGVACDNDPVLPGRDIAPRSPVHLITGVDTDATMGIYSPVARHIAWALRDSVTRMALMRFLKSDSSATVGADLHDCGGNGFIKTLFDVAERKGAGLSSVACGIIARRTGGVLYMDRDRLRAWDGSTIPIVTAIEQPARPLGRTFHGYLATDQVIDLPADGSMAGPILVILPLIHPKRHEFARNRGTDRTVTVASPPPGLNRLPTPTRIR